MSNPWRGGTIFWIFGAVGAVLVFLLWLALRSGDEQIRFTIVNADSGEVVTNVEVTAYRPRSPLSKQVSEFLGGPMVHVEKLGVSSSGIVETVGPHGSNWITVYFTPHTNFATVIFNRGPAGDTFSTVTQTGRNHIRIALQPEGVAAKR